MKTLNKILLIDDDSNTNFYNKIMLEDVNASNQILEFINAKEALKYLENNEEPIDLILLDINMPTMNGWQFLDEFDKLNEECVGNAIIVMLTSSVNCDDKEKALQYKCVKKFQNKPLFSDSVKDILALFE